MVTKAMSAMASPKSSLRASPRIPLRILIAQDSLQDFQLCVRVLESRHWNLDATQVSSRDSFESLLLANTYDVILADYQLQNWTGMDALEVLKQAGNETPLILVANSVGEEKAIQCIREGAADLILKTHLDFLPAAVCRAISEKSIQETRKRSEATLRESEARFRTLADSIATAVLIYRGMDCRYANRAAQKLSGYSEGELLALSSWDLIHPDSRSLLIERGMSRVPGAHGPIRCEAKILTKQGEVRFWDMTLGKIEIDGEAAGLLTALDITEIKAEQALREHDGCNDPLTGLLGAMQVQGIFQTESKRSQRSGRSFAFLLLKMDGLYRIHERSGMAEGSRVLCTLACNIGEVCRTADAAARFSEDEFVLLLPETSQSGARRMIQRLTERMRGDSNRLSFAMSYGIAMFPQDGSTFDHAMRSAKKTLRKVDVSADKELEHSA
jgi:diguanylate cyclase (GGDEF)-like protein/PAS domain S-box-containing protein